MEVLLFKIGEGLIIEIPDRQRFGFIQKGEEIFCIDHVTVYLVEITQKLLRPIGKFIKRLCILAFKTPYGSRIIQIKLAWITNDAVRRC